MDCSTIANNAAYVFVDRQFIANPSSFREDTFCVVTPSAPIIAPIHVFHSNYHLALNLRCARKPPVEVAPPF